MLLLTWTYVPAEPSNNGNYKLNPSDIRTQAECRRAGPTCKNHNTIRPGARPPGRGRPHPFEIRTRPSLPTPVPYAFRRKISLVCRPIVRTLAVVQEAPDQPQHCESCVRRISERDVCKNRTAAKWAVGFVVVCAGCLISGALLPAHSRTGLRIAECRGSRPGGCAGRRILTRHAPLVAPRPAGFCHRPDVCRVVLRRTRVYRFRISIGNLCASFDCFSGFEYFRRYLEKKNNTYSKYVVPIDEWSVIIAAFRIISKVAQITSEHLSMELFVYNYLEIFFTNETQSSVIRLISDLR